MSNNYFDVIARQRTRPKDEFMDSQITSVAEIKDGEAAVKVAKSREYISKIELKEAKAKLDALKAQTGVSSAKDVRALDLTIDLAEARSAVAKAREARKQAVGELGLVAGCSVPDLSEENKALCAQLKDQRNADLNAALKAIEALKKAEARLSQLETRYRLSSEIRAAFKAVDFAEFQLGSDSQTVKLWEAEVKTDREDFRLANEARLRKAEADAAAAKKNLSDAGYGSSSSGASEANACVAEFSF